jgi:hypothetical protein
MTEKVKELQQKIERLRDLEKDLDWASLMATGTIHRITITPVKCGPFDVPECLWDTIQAIMGGHVAKLRREVDALTAELESMLPAQW